MPDASGRIRPVAFPHAAWCARCKLYACVCAPLPVVTQHVNCGTPSCCRAC